MQPVSLSEAARLANISRATLYRHIKQGRVSVVKDRADMPTIDVAELIRTYGHLTDTNDMSQPLEAAKLAAALEEANHARQQLIDEQKRMLDVLHQQLDAAQKREAEVSDRLNRLENLLLTYKQRELQRLSETRKGGAVLEAEAPAPRVANPRRPVEAPAPANRPSADIPTLNDTVASPFLSQNSTREVAREPTRVPVAPHSISPQEANTPLMTHPADGDEPMDYAAVLRMQTSQALSPAPSAPMSPGAPEATQEMAQPVCPVAHDPADDAVNETLDNAGHEPKNWLYWLRPRHKDGAPPRPH